MHAQPFVYNFPSFSILLCLMAGMSAPFFKNGRVAQKINFGVTVVAGALNAIVFGTLAASGESYTYMMGHFPAPWGNELRGGPLEALLATAFCLVMALAQLGGLSNTYQVIAKKKQYLFFLMSNLMLASLIALTYTNDMFNAYVFIEINTIASCALVAIRNTGPSIIATIRYMIMSSLGSGLLLFGVCTMYNITGHLLMSDIQEQLIQIFENGEYAIPLTVIMCLCMIGVAIKSAIFPFYTWTAGAYGNASTTGSAMLSGLAQKGYLVLLIKMAFRVFTPEMLASYHVTDAILILGVAGMIMGSVKALQQRDSIKRMLAYSSAAQIGYIFMGIGLGSQIGVVAACYQILAHAFTKPMLFVAAGSLIDRAGGREDIRSLKGTALKRPLAGIAFSIGSLSMIGIPIFAGFVPKVFFATGGLQGNWFQLAMVLIALAISTVLNALYYLPACVNIWTPRKGDEKEEAHGHGHDAHGHGAELAVDPREVSLTTIQPKEKQGVAFFASMILFMACNFGLGLLYEPISKVIELGVTLLG